MKSEIVKVVITGPESTGKSTLTKSLATYFNEPFVDEMAREYLNNLQRPYKFNDLKEIAILQLAEEDKKIKGAKKFIFIDTDLIVLKIWSNYKYKKCDSFILESLSHKIYQYYLLCNTDLPWCPDPLRESPDIKTRKELFRINKTELQFYKKSFSVISGNEKNRLETAINLVNELRTDFFTKFKAK